MFSATHYFSAPFSMYSLHLLGGVVLEEPDGPVRGRASHTRRLAVLAILALGRGRPVPRERIVGLLWGGHPGDAARRLLTESLYVLRKELGEDALRTVGDEIGLALERVRCDALELEAAAEAGDAERVAALYRGPLLDGFVVGDAPEFERWAEEERDRMARLYARVVEAAADAAEGDERTADAVRWWRLRAAADPYSGRVALRLMHALDAAGERAAALRFAQTHAALVRAELETEPDDAVTRLAERLRTEPSPARPLAAPQPPRPGADAPATADDARPLDGSEHPVDPVLAVDSGGADSGDAEDAGPATLRVEGGGPASLSGPIVDGAPARAPGSYSPPPSSPPIPSTTQSRQTRWLAAVAGLVLGLAAAVAPWRSAPAGAPADDGYDPRRIAVLYFDDHSPGGELGYLASGLTESLIHALAQVDALDVISRNGVKPYRDHPVRFDSMAAELRAGSLVEGSVQREGDSVHITVQLVDANTNSHLESRTSTHAVERIAAMEEAVAQEVAAFLRRRLGRQVALRETRAATGSEVAIRRVMEAEAKRDDAARLSRSGAPADAASADRALEAADSLLALAERADPAWARPTLLRGWIALGRGRTAASGERALHAAERVLARDASSAEALELRGAARFRAATTDGGPGADAALDAAEGDLRGAVAQRPSLASAWGALSQVLAYRGRFAEADLAARRALAEDAYLDDADDVLHRLFFAALFTADYRAAQEACGQGRIRFPGDWRFLECRLTLLREDTARVPQPAEAWRVMEALERVDPASRAAAEGRSYTPAYRLAVVAAILARAGEADSARAVMAQARRAAASPDDAVSLDYDEAYVRLLLGEREAARRLLASVLARRPALRSFAARDPLLRGLIAPGATGTPPAGGRAPSRPPS